jgi:hypothetical protein
MSSCGVKLPVRLLKSPHIITVSYGYAKSIISSTYYVACYSVIFRNFSDDYGGMYILIILIRMLLGNNNFNNIPYSFSCVVSI